MVVANQNFRTVEPSRTRLMHNFRRGGQVELCRKKGWDRHKRQAGSRAGCRLACGLFCFGEERWSIGKKTRIMKKGCKTYLFGLCWIANCLLLVYWLCGIVLILAGHESVAGFFFSSVYSQCVIFVLAIPTLILLVKSHFVCYRKDTAEAGLRLFFLEIFYTPFYFWRMHRNGWIWHTGDANLAKKRRNQGWNVWMAKISGGQRVC